MFGWFKPRCPLATEEKVWVESRLSWLVAALGAERMLHARVIEPTDQFFPDDYDESPAAAERLFERVVQYMRIDPARVTLEVRTDWDHECPLGVYHRGQPSKIEVNADQLDDPERLVAVLAHELAHEILLGGGLLTENNEDLERLTDLVPTFLGLGIFNANAKVRERSSGFDRFSWWSMESMEKLGYLPMRMHAYGLALFAYAREETLPSWADYLRPDIREPMLQGLRFLGKTSDTTLEIPRSYGLDELRPLADCIRRLADASPSHRYFALNCLAEHGPAAVEAMDRIARLLDDSNPDVTAASADALAALGPAARVHASKLKELLFSRVAAQRIQAAMALGTLEITEGEVVEVLVALLEDREPGVAGAAVFALAKCAPGNESVARRLLPSFEAALRKCDYPRIALIGQALHATSVDPSALVREHLLELGADIVEFGEHCLAEAVAGPEHYEPDDDGQPAAAASDAP